MVILHVLASLVSTTLTVTGGRYGQASQPRLVSNGLEGYISMEVTAPPKEYGYGVSLYATAWPLTTQPIRDFQIGLASIWIVPDNREIEYPLLPKGTVARDNWPERGPSYRDVFQTIEGGLGFWASTRFGSTTAKFRMNGTPDGYNHEISSPGWGFGNTEAFPVDQMGIAQLSSRILVPPDGFTFRAGTNGDVLGYAWMALPLIRAKESTAGYGVPTGDQSWTLFVNAMNCKGPVAFFTPATWSRISRKYPPAAKRGLDSRPGLVTGGAIEVNTVPRYVSKDAKGVTYTKIPTLQFPADEQGRTILIHDLTHYSKDAIYRQVESWLKGGSVPEGRFDLVGASSPTVTANELSLRQGEAHLPISGFTGRVGTKALDRTTFGLEWDKSALQPWSKQMRRGTFPEYFREEGGRMIAVREQDVPEETGLRSAAFPRAESIQSYASPEGPGSAWTMPGPKAGPFHVRLSDGSVVTYSWYRFIDQPALQDADLSAGERERLQIIAEKIQANWTLNKEYLPPPKVGRLVEIDPALIVKPPKGLEVGYVPIAIRQSPG
ncbi:MAG: hypothetical protein P4L46_09160 [Fimbriimonas sp.]|nr:hypothetical protein [Fimbriimonas sp.]